MSSIAMTSRVRQAQKLPFRSMKKSGLSKRESIMKKTPTSHRTMYFFFFELLYREIIVSIIVKRSNGSPSLLCFDGEFAQIEATFTELIQLVSGENIEIMKFPAATTMLYQPNDLMRSHSLIHQYVTSPAYVRDKDSNPIKPQWMTIVDKTLKENAITTASKDTFSKFFIHLPVMLGRAFKSDNITSGWKSSGLVPLNACMTMNKISNWNELNGSETIEVINAIRELVDVAKVSGVVHDQLIEEKIGHLNFRRREVAPEDPMNHQRSLWMNKDGALAIRAVHEEARRKKRIQLQQRQERIRQRALQKTIAEQADATDLQLLNEEPEEDHFPIICARTLCRNIILTADCDSSKWGNCPSCRGLWYYYKKLCQSEGSNHIDKCVFNNLIINSMSNNNSGM